MPFRIVVCTQCTEPQGYELPDAAGTQAIRCDRCGTASQQWLPPVHGTGIAIGRFGTIGSPRPGAPRSLDTTRVTANDLLARLASGPEYSIRGPVFICPPHSTGEAPLYRHQADAVDAFHRNGSASGLFHLPTGSGKTRLALELIAERLRSSPRERIIWVSYPTILVRQGMLRLAQQGGLFPEGTRIQWAKSGERRPDLLEDAEITFLMREGLTSILEEGLSGPLGRTLAGQLPSAGPSVTIIYDECHQLAADGLQSAFRRFFRALPPSHRERLRILGLSATPLPSAPDKHSLLVKEIFPVGGRTSARPEWNMLVHAASEVDDLVRDEVLCPLNLDIDQSGVFRIPPSVLREAGADVLSLGGDIAAPRVRQRFLKQFNSRVMGHDSVLQFLADRIASNWDALGKVLFFAPKIEAANRLAQLLKNRLPPGSVSVVHSGLDAIDDASLTNAGALPTDVHAQIQAFKDRGHQPCIMINVGMLTTGFDDPAIRTVILGRLTLSTNLFWQMIGRGTRGLSCRGGTEDCIVIDPIRLVEQHSALEGYRPTVVGPPISAPPTDDGRSTTIVPVRQRPPVVARGTMPVMDDGLTDELRQLLREFLEGGPMSPRLADAVATRLDEASDGKLGVRFVPASEAPESAGIWMPRVAVKRLEDDLRNENPSIDLSWLLSAQFLPARYTAEEIRVFELKMALVREHKAYTVEAYRLIEMNILRTQVELSSNGRRR